MSHCAHRRVSIDVYGPGANVVFSTSNLYCSDDATGANAVKKWVREEAKRRGIRLGTWDYLRHDARLEWDGRVYGDGTSAL